MKKSMRTIWAVIAAVAVSAMILVGAPSAYAAGSDSPTPYTVTVEGVRLPAGDSFQAHGHINWRTTTGSYGMHFDPNNNQPGGAFIGKDFFPITLAPGECITWAQVSHYNEHFGEGGQAPVCAPEEEPPFTGVEKYTPAYSATCEGWAYAHPEFRLPTGERPTGYTVRIGAGTEPVAYTPGEGLSGVFADPYQANMIEITLWAQYADGKPFAKQQLGQTKLRAAACEKPRPDMPEVRAGVEERVGDAVCVVPADGTKSAPREERSWEQGWTFDEASWSWVDAEIVYGDWVTVEPVVSEDAECAPVEEPEENAVPEPEPKEKPVKQIVAPSETPLPVAPALVQTGAGVAWSIALPLGVSGLILGALLVSAAIRGRKS